MTGRPTGKGGMTKNVLTVLHLAKIGAEAVLKGRKKKA